MRLVPMMEKESAGKRIEAKVRREGQEWGVPSQFSNMH